MLTNPLNAAGRLATRSLTALDRAARRITLEVDGKPGTRRHWLILAAAGTAYLALMSIAFIGG